MKDYKYISPLEEGFKQFKLTKEQHNTLFKYRQIKWFDKYEYYYNKDMIKLHRFYNWKAIIASTLFFPVTLIIHGVENLSEISNELKCMYNQKMTGNFSGDAIWKDSDTYTKIIELINKK
jgi:hypothetical protein